MRPNNRFAPDMEDFEPPVSDQNEVSSKPRRRRRQEPEQDLVDVPDDEPTTNRRTRGNKSRVRTESDGPQRKKPKKSEPSFDLIAFFRDPRLHLGFGIFLCFIAIVSIVTCVSFISANEADQSTTLGRSIQDIVEAGDTIENAGNSVGAKIAHFLMVDTLGLGSIIIAIYIFMLGLACMRFVRINFWSLSFRSIFSGVSTSIIVGLLTYGSVATFPLGGIHGIYVNQYLKLYGGDLLAFGVSSLLAALLVVIFLYPIKTFILTVKSLIPERQKTLEEDVVEDGEENPSLSALETSEEGAAELSLTPGEVVASDEQPIEEENIEEQKEAPLPAISDLEVPGEGFTIDEEIPQEVLQETAEAKAESIVAQEVPAEDKAITEVSSLEQLDEVEEIPVVVMPPVSVDQVAVMSNDVVEMPSNPSDSASEGPAEPEMIVKVAPDEGKLAGGIITDGDHIGLGTPFNPLAEHSNYVFPSTDLLLDRDIATTIDPEEQNANKEMIINALRSFGVEIQRIELNVGPTVTLYEIVPAEGVRINKIRSLEDDIALNLSALGIRIIAPMPGKGTIGIEVPNRVKQTVGMKRLIESAAFQQCKEKMSLPVALGATISNEMYIQDLAKMPHLLVAGATGQGKSVGLNCIITSLLYAKHPDELKFVLVDPKMVEFSLYRDIDKAFMAKLPEEEKAIITDPMKVVATLNSLCVEMDKRYELLSEAMVRDIVAYNKKFSERKLNPENGHRYLPYIVMIVDEFADLITTAGKDVSLPIARIAQKGRAAGMHMIIATQRPSTDVITGMIKANFPARIAFRVLSSIDSKTILDRPGAHQLIGRGDMLAFISGEVKRVQCAFVDTPEIEAITEHIGHQSGFTTCYPLPEVPVEGAEPKGTVEVNLRNEEFNRCALYISTQTTASITVLQRKFQIGFNKAGRYMDQMESLGIVGPANGAKPRQVLMSPDEVQRLIAEA